MESNPIVCKLCNTPAPVSDGNQLATACQCGCVSVAWDVFETPPKATRVRVIDRKGMPDGLLKG